MVTRFALLRHELPDAESAKQVGRPSHWDLLLERDAGCWTWALEHLPAGLRGMADPATVMARRLPDHRKLYLDYEGPVSGERGFVRRELDGECEWMEQEDFRIRLRLKFVDDEVQVLLAHLHDDIWQLSTP